MVKIGEKYTICVPYIAGIYDTCHVIEVKTQDDIDRVKGYIKSRRHKVTKDDNGVS